MVETRLANRARLSDSPAMRRRLPSPALVIASIALFVALGGAGFAASFVLVKSPKPLVLLPGNVSADGKVTGPHLSGARVRQGVYTLTIIGATFAPSSTVARIQSLVSPHVITIVGSNKVIDPTCDTSAGRVAANGSAKIEIDCYRFDPGTGWQPADAAFDVQVSGPTA
jgi:hypothetical protein